MASRKTAKTIKAIREALNGQLADKGMELAHYQELVDDYVKSWELAVELRADIKERGAKVCKLDSRGQEQTVNNESIDQLLKVQASMLRILETLGLSAPKGGGIGGVDNDPL